MLDEEAFSHLLRAFTSQGEGVSKNSLNLIDLKWPSKKQKKALSFLNRISLLLGHTEIVRRLNPGIKSLPRSDLQIQIPEFPLASSYAMILKLWENNHLDIKDVLDKDAPYGPFTEMKFSDGTKRTLPQKFFKVFEKIIKLQDEYINSLSEGEENLCKRNPETDKLMLSQEQIKNLLKQTFIKN